MASTPTRLTTFAEFESLPTREGSREELRHSVLIEMAPPATPDSHTVTYRTGSEIPWLLALDKKLSVDAIFAPVAD